MSCTGTAPADRIIRRFRCDSMNRTAPCAKGNLQHPNCCTAIRIDLPDKGRPASAAPHTAGAPMPDAAISHPLTLFLAAAIGVVALNLYASQPLIGLIGPALGLTNAAASLTTTFTLLGYAAGLVLLVPLVDIVANRALILWTLAFAVLFLVLAMFAPSAPLFLAAAIAIGFTATVTQMLVTVAAALSPASDRGRVVGNVMSGLTVGTLLSRPLASLVADTFGWRSVFGLTAILIGLLAVTISKVLPDRRPAPGPPYRALIASLWILLRDEPILRRRSVFQLLLMGGFSAFWTAIALRLAEPPFELTQRGVALFALAAAGSTVVAPLAGRAADRGLTRRATFVAQAAAMVAVLLAGAAADGMWSISGLSADALLGVLAIAAFVLSAAVTGDQILGRHAINAIRPDARGRVNGLYTGLMFVGGSAGAFAAGPAWDYGGWSAVCGIGFAFVLTAFTLHVLQRH